MAEPGEQTRGTTIATVTTVDAITAGATVTAEQTTLTTVATVVAGAGAIGIPTRATVAIDPPTGATVRISGRAVRAVTEWHQPIDLAPIERRVRGTRKIKRSGPDTGQIQIRQDRIPHGRLAETFEEGRPTPRVENHRPGGLVAPIGTQIDDGVT